MKTIFTLLFCIATIAATAQATTQIEYNYMKNGYRETEEKGLDVKKGYTAVLIDEKDYADMQLTVTLLKRADSTNAGLIFKTNGKSAFGSGLNYYCMPAVNLVNKDSFGWAEFYKDVNNMTGGQKTYILAWLSYRLAYEMGTKKK